MKGKIVLKKREAKAPLSDFLSKDYSLIILNVLSALSLNTLIK